MRYRLMATYRGVPYEAGLGPTDGDVVLLAACPPPEDLDFEPATGHWRKLVGRAEVALWESRPTGIFCGEPCLVLDDLGDRLHIAYLGDDPYSATRLGYHQVEPAVFEVVTAREAVTGLTEERVQHNLHPWQPAAPSASAALPAAPAAPSAAPAASPLPSAAPPLPSTARPLPSVTPPAVSAASPLAPATPPSATHAPATPSSVSASPPSAPHAPATPPSVSATPLPPSAAPPAVSSTPPRAPGPDVAPATSPRTSPAPPVPPSTPPALPTRVSASAPDVPYARRPAEDARPASLNGEWGSRATRITREFRPAPPTPDVGPAPRIPGLGPAPIPAEPAPAPPAPAASGLAPAAPGPAPAAPARSRRGRSGARKPRTETRWIFSELANLAALPSAAYAVNEEIDGAICLISTDHGFEVFTAVDGARHEMRVFEDEEAAYFYMFGLLAAEAVRDGRLVPRPGG
ncbi:MAG TPA: hypothetical protein VGL63_06095 [Streptosporangiaceae bacterium]|jgi:hypothetical protein